MRKIIIVLCCLTIFSCKNENTTGTFTITGEIKNATDQKIYLEEIQFNQDPPTVLDTAQIVNGKFTFKSSGTEEGLFRIRLEKGAGYIFINDKQELLFTADATDESYRSQTFNSPANASLKKFIGSLDSLQGIMNAVSNGITALKGSSAKDSAIKASENNLAQITSQYNNFILKYIDTTASPIVALFALGYTQQIKADTITTTVNALGQRFPAHHSVTALVNKYNQALTQNKSNDPQLAEAAMAPDFTMPDVNGKPLSLSFFKGKYVLVDFWASWCGPCREENPNVVIAYNKFKDKNFTILGVSLDKEKAAWLKAIKDDGLTWNHMSDLKFWNSAAVPLYKIEGIPSNVLIDPQGKVIGKDLRGADLESKLEEVLK